MDIIAAGVIIVGTGVIGITAIGAIVIGGSIALGEMATMVAATIITARMRGRLTVTPIAARMRTASACAGGKPDGDVTDLKRKRQGANPGVFYFGLRKAIGARASEAFIS